MKEFKGTTGPWYVTTGDSNIPDVTNISGAEIAYMSEWPAGEHASNANLIAAAPELLEALRQLRDYVEDMHSAQYGHHWKDESHPMFLASVAINKALGKD